jgi:pyruvate/2-oxoglutarate dehydrogenase complex dihydrolipoamide acyltransferase (E2) component
VEFRLPDIGEGLESGEIVAWLVKEGDEVARDQPIVEVQTDKALVELPSPVPGRVVSLAVQPGDIVPVGQLLLVLDTGAAPASANGAPAATQATAATVPATPAEREPAPAASRPKAAPSVRKLALERGIDLSTVTGTGPGGRILAADLDRPTATGVQKAPIARLPNAGTPGSGTGVQKGPPERVPNAALAQPDPGVQNPPIGQVSNAALGQMAPGRHPLRGIRRVTAEAMKRSWSEIPHITAMDELDATALLDARRHLDGVSLPALFLAACARALRRFPLVNASLAGDEIVVHEDCHIGVAVATDAGLIVPVVKDADRRSLPDLAQEIARLVTAARAGRADLADLQGGTFTVTNYGSLGGRYATPLIRPPEAAIMGFGAIRPRPFVVDGAVVPRPTLPYCLSADHRLIDGDLATAFGEHVARLLTAPIRLFAE